MMGWIQGLFANFMLAPAFCQAGAGGAVFAFPGRVLCLDDLSSETDDDAGLMIRIAAGDEEAMRLLFERWKRPLISFFYRSIPNRADAEDLTLAVFERLHRAAARYRPSARFSTYLFQIARRLLLNEYRRKSRKPVVLIEPGMMDYHGGGPDSSRRLAELEEIFQMALGTLPERQRTALLLQTQQNLDQAEAAEVMGVSPGAFRVLVHRGRQAIKEKMKEEL
jgi:RNA polymerase sigma-70 factor (ECF subfamily)